MALHGVFEVLVHFDTFRNIDLFRQGAYRVACTLVSDGGGVHAIPYAEFRLQPGSGSSMWTLPGAAIDSKRLQFTTRAFIIQYIDETVPVHEAVQFRIELETNEKLAFETCTLDLALQFCSTRGRGNRSIDDAEFETVSTRRVRLLGMKSGMQHLMPLQFDLQHLCAMRMIVHALLIDFVFRPPRVLNVNDPFQSQSAPSGAAAPSSGNSAGAGAMGAPIGMLSFARLLFGAQGGAGAADARAAPPPSASGAPPAVSLLLPSSSSASSSAAGGAALSAAEARVSTLQAANLHHACLSNMRDNYLTLAKRVDTFSNQYVPRHLRAKYAAAALRLPDRFAQSPSPAVGRGSTSSGAERPPASSQSLPQVTTADAATVTTPAASAGVAFGAALGVASALRPPGSVSSTPASPARTSAPSVGLMHLTANADVRTPLEELEPRLLAPALAEDFHFVAEQLYRLWDVLVQLLHAAPQSWAVHLQPPWDLAVRTRWRRCILTEAHPPASRSIFVASQARRVIGVASNIRQMWRYKTVPQYPLEPADVDCQPEHLPVVLEEAYTVIEASPYSADSIVALPPAPPPPSSGPGEPPRAPSPPPPVHSSNGVGVVAHASSAVDAMATSRSRTLTPPPALLPAPPPSAPGALQLNHVGAIGNEGSATGRVSAAPSAAQPAGTSSAGAPVRPAGSKGVHLIVFVHGFQGSSYDLRLFKAHMSALSLPSVVFLLSSSNENKTTDSVQEMGLRLAAEVTAAVRAHARPVERLSFVAHSLGTLMVRSALCDASFKAAVGTKLHTFVSMSGPHVGTVYMDSALVGGAMSVLRGWKNAMSLRQLSLGDADDPRQCFVYQLAHQPVLRLFKNVMLLSSPQDRYVPYHSARMEMCEAAQRDARLGGVYAEMVHALMRSLDGVTFVRFDVSFPELGGRTLDNLIGRTAHIAFLDNSLFIEMFVTTHRGYFV